MQLIAAVVGFVLRKVGFLAVVLVTLFIGYLIVHSAIPSVQDSVAQRERLGEVIKEQEALRTTLEEKQHKLAAKSDDVCNKWQDLIAKPLPGNPCKDAQAAIDKAKKELRDVETTIASAKAEEKKLRDARESGIGWVVDQADKNWKWLLWLSLLVIFLPPVLRVVGYFVLMPVVTRVHKPIRLAAGSEHTDGTLHVSTGERTMAVQLAPGESLAARSEYVRPVRGKTRGRLLYDWSAPFISFAAGLYGQTRITGDEDGTAAT